MAEIETVEVTQDGEMFFVRKITYTNKNPDFGHGVRFSITEDGINTIARHAPIVKELKDKIADLEIDVKNLQEALMAEGHARDCPVVIGESMDCYCEGTASYVYRENGK